MNRMTKMASGWGGVVLGGVLLALPAAADEEKCQAECASKVAEVMQQCVLKCPQPTNAGSTRSYQACAMRCSQKFQDRFDTCAQSCDSGKNDSTGKKKKGKGWAIGSRS